MMRHEPACAVSGRATERIHGRVPLIWRLLTVAVVIRAVMCAKESVSAKEMCASVAVES